MEQYFNALIMEKWQKYPSKFCFVYLWKQNISMFIYSLIFYLNIRTRSSMHQFVNEITLKVT